MKNVQTLSQAKSTYGQTGGSLKGRSSETGPTYDWKTRL